MHVHEVAKNHDDCDESNENSTKKAHKKTDERFVAYLCLENSDHEKHETALDALRM